MGNAYAVIENKQSPVITIRFTGEGATDESFQQYLGKA